MKKILVAVDFSKNTEKVVEQATTLAKGLSAKAWVIHVTSDQLQASAYEYLPASSYSFPLGFVGPTVSDIQMARELCANEYKREHQALLQLSGKMRHDGVDTQALLMKGDAAGLILKQAEDLNVNMIIMGSHGHGLLHKFVVGSVSEAVLRKALCNVLIVPPPAE